MELGSTPEERCAVPGVRVWVSLMHRRPLLGWNAGARLDRRPALQRRAPGAGEAGAAWVYQPHQRRVGEGSAGASASRRSANPATTS